MFLREISAFNKAFNKGTGRPTIKIEFFLREGLGRWRSVSILIYQAGIPPPKA